MIRLIIVDDHQAFAEGLAVLIDDVPDFTVVGTTGNARSATTMIQRTAPDLVLCDIRLGSVDGGLELLARHPRTPFIMISAYLNPTYVVNAVSRGARGYLSKSAGIEEIVSAIRTVFAGGHAFPDVARRAIGHALPPPTPEELAVLLLLAQGLSYREIAALLSLSVRTVETRLHRSFTRYGVTNRVALVRLAIRQGWIEPDL